MTEYLLPAFTATKRDNVDALEGKVLCADALELLAQLPDSSVDMVLCDLPYGVTACAWDSIIPIEPMWAQLKRVVKQRAAIVLTATQPFTSRLVASNYEMFRYEWIWDKKLPTGLQIATYRPMQKHENILVFSKKPHNYYPIMTRREKVKIAAMVSQSDSSPIKYNDGKTRAYAERYPVSILEFSNANQTDKVHSTQKPVALFEYLIRTYTQEGELVLDMTCGSGTTGLAARKTGRRFICGDNSPEYVALANRRLVNTDPFRDSVLPDGTKQLSLFSKLSA